MYAFSIENFRRSEDEVNALLQLAKEKFEVDTAHLLLIIVNAHLPIDTKQSKTHMTGLDWGSRQACKAWCESENTRRHLPSSSGQSSSS